MSGTEFKAFLTEEEQNHYSQVYDQLSDESITSDPQPRQTSNDIEAEPVIHPREDCFWEDGTASVISGLSVSSHTASDCPSNTAPTCKSQLSPACFSIPRVSPFAQRGVAKRKGRPRRSYAPGDAATIHPSATAFFRATDLAKDLRLKPDCVVLQEYATAMLHQERRLALQIDPKQ